MLNTSDHNADVRNARRLPRSIFTLCLFSLMACGLAAAIQGCTEFSHFGHVLDEVGNPIHDVEIQQQGSDGEWRHIARTDGKGKMNIFKDKFHGGNIRLRKRGYYTRIFLESEFFKEQQVLMRATGDSEYGPPLQGDLESWGH